MKCKLQVYGACAEAEYCETPVKRHRPPVNKSSRVKYQHSLVVTPAIPKRFWFGSKLVRYSGIPGLCSGFRWRRAQSVSGRLG